MSKKTRSELKTFYQTGLKPTQAQFEHLIDSALNLSDDPLTISSDRVGIGSATHTAPLTVGAEDGDYNQRFLVAEDPSGIPRWQFELFTDGYNGLHSGPVGGAPTLSLLANGNVGIGISDPQCLLHIEAGTLTIKAEREAGVTIYSMPGPDMIGAGTHVGLHVTGNEAYNNYGGHFEAWSDYNNNTGVRGTATGSSTWNYGVVGEAVGEANRCIGVSGFADGASGAGQPKSIGVQGAAFGGKFAYGVMGQAYDGTDASYAIYSDGEMYLDGDLHMTGGINNVSDGTLKKNIKPLGSIMSAVAQLKPMEYEFRTSAITAAFNLPTGKQLGFVAQDFETVFPNLVREVAVGPKEVAKAHKDEIDGGPDSGSKKTERIKTIDYMRLIPVLTAALQEQQQQINTLTSQLAGMGGGGGGGVSPDMFTGLADQVDLLTRSLERLPEFVKARDEELGTA